MSISRILLIPDLVLFLPYLDPATSGSGSGFAGSLPGQIRVEIRFHRISTRQYPGLDPVSPGLYPAKSGSGSGFAGSLPGKIRIWIRFRRISTRQNPDLDPVAAGSLPGSCRIQGSPWFLLPGSGSTTHEASLVHGQLAGLLVPCQTLGGMVAH